MLLLAHWASWACLKGPQTVLAARSSSCSRERSDLACLFGARQLWVILFVQGIFSLVVWTCEWRLCEVFTLRLNILRLLMCLRIQFRRELPVSACLPAHSPFCFRVLLSGEERHMDPPLSAGPRCWTLRSLGPGWVRQTHKRSVREQPAGRACASLQWSSSKSQFPKGWILCVCVLHFFFFCINYYIQIKEYWF